MYLAIASHAADLAVGQDPGVPDGTIDSNLVPPDAATRVQNILEEEKQSP